LLPEEYQKHKNSINRALAAPAGGLMSLSMQRDYSRAGTKYLSYLERASYSFN